MSNLVFLPRIPRDGAESKIREIASKASHEIYILDHAKMRMLEREITQRQIFKALINGELLEGPEWDTKEDKGWKCKFSRIVAGEKVTVVAKLVDREDSSCLVITVW
jgi:hypothetical protein